MSDYTSRLRFSMDSVSFEDDDFMEKLLEIAHLFRPFSEAMDAFLARRGFDASRMDVDGKTACIRDVFLKAGMEPPREVREWFTAGQPIRRETAFQICFAFGLDGNETDEFFREYYARERSFNCHRVEEAVYYFCLNNGLSYGEARDIIAAVPAAEDGAKGGDQVYTASIIAELNSLTTRDELIRYLTDNRNIFTVDNVTAYAFIRRLWDSAAGPGGLLIRERERLPSMLDDMANLKRSPVREGDAGVRPWDAYLAILQLDKQDVKRLRTDRSIQPVIERLHAGARDSFPDRQGIDLILRGKRVSYERVRKWLVLLSFYTFWARRALDRGDYAACPEDGERCVAHMDQVLTDAGYPEMYVGNPYDWIFFYAAGNDEPLPTFRYIFNELLASALDGHP